MKVGFCIKMEAIGFHVDSIEYKLSKMNILKGLVTEKMTTAVREILAVVEKTVVGIHSSESSQMHTLSRVVSEKMTTAVREMLSVVETTVVGYEDEVSLLKREVNRLKKQLDAFLQPQTSLYEIDLDGDRNQDPTDPVATNKSKDEQSLEINRLEHKETGNKSTSENEADSMPTNAQVSQEEMESSEHEDGDCTSEDLPSESCPSNTEGSHSHDQINDVQNKDCKIKRRKQLPSRYRSNFTDTDASDERLQMSNVKKRRVIKLEIGVLKCSDTELSDNAFRPTPVCTIKCQQNLSESDFLKELRSTFPELRENKPFEAFLSDSSEQSPLLVNRMTPTDLFKAFRSTRKRQFNFYIQLKDHKHICVPPTNALTSHDDNKPSTSSCGSLVEQPSETGEICKSTDEADMLCADSATQSEEDEEQDHDKSNDWKPEQNEELSDAFKSEKSCFKKKKRVQKLPSKAFIDNSDCCEVCGTSFRSRAVLTKHALSHVDNPEGLCGVCGQHFQSSVELRCHLDTHQKLHQCDSCGRFFISKFGLRKHFVIHGIEKPFKCQICSQAFVCEDDLTRHEVVHKDKPYKCDTCPKAFWYKDQLDVHTRIHTGEKQFCCDVCGKLLSDYRSLCRHKQIHTGQKNYSCKYCGKLFLFLRSQKQHETIHTTREKTFVCDICSKSFYTQAKLKCHQQIHDGKHIIKCTVCNKLLKRNLGAHMMIHTGEKPFSCSECGKKFRSKTNLNNHTRTHQIKTKPQNHTGIKPFTCKICGKMCGRREHLKVHMRTHTGDKPYKCTLCDKAFTQGSTLKTHMKIHQREQQSVAHASA